MRAPFLLLAPTVLLAGCLTTQENPNYEYSSKYRPPAAIQTAQTSSPVIASTTQTYPVQSVTYEAPNTYGTSTITPVQVIEAPVHAPNTVITASTGATYPHASQNVPTVSPTDSQFAGQEVTGTPGFMALAQSAQTESVQTNIVQSDSRVQPQIVNYDYSPNLITADTAIDQPDIADEIRIIPSAGQSYTVQQGDTIYALSRRHCVGVDVIRSMNGIGADYAINIGQSISLPASRC